MHVSVRTTGDRVHNPKRLQNYYSTTLTLYQKNHSSGLYSLKTLRSHVYVQPTSEYIFAPGLECNITSGVRTVRRCASVAIADHGGLGFAGEVAACGLVERAAAGGAVTRAVRGRVGPSVARYGRLPT